MTWVTPSSLPMASAVRWLSPVSMTTSRPSLRKASTAAALVGLGVSATAMRPSTRLLIGKVQGSLALPGQFLRLLGETPQVHPASSSMAWLPATQEGPPPLQRWPGRPGHGGRASTGAMGRFRFRPLLRWRRPAGARREPPDRRPG